MSTGSGGTKGIVKPAPKKKTLKAGSPPNVIIKTGFYMILRRDLILLPIKYR